MTFYLRSVVTGLAFGAIAAAQTAAAAPLLNYDGFSYTGSVTVYDTLAGAQAGMDARSGPHGVPTVSNGDRTTLVQARDGSVFSDGTALLFLTAWYFTPQEEATRGTNGFGNPNNTNTGFVQMFDLDGSTVSARSQGWDDSRMRYSINATGSNAGADEVARLWAAPESGGPASITAGTFFDYTLDFTAMFDERATRQGNLLTTDADPIDVVGSFQGIFENTNATDPSLNGFYAFDFSFQPESWARQTEAVALFRDGTDIASTFQEVPAPASFLLLGVGLLGLANLRRR